MSESGVERINPRNSRSPEVRIPHVSVIIPTYNRADLIANAIQSVLDQTYRDYEIIVVDDGSVDDTKEKIKFFGDRLRYFYQENRGASAAQNKGIELARGKWISILASDDTWMPKKLELQLEAVTELGEQFGACFTDCRLIGLPGRYSSAFGLAGLRSEDRYGRLDRPLDYVFARYPAIFVQSLLVKKDLVDGVNGFDLNMVVSEDTDLLFRLAFKTVFCFINELLVNVDRTPSRSANRLSSIITRMDDQMFRSKEALFLKWLGILESEGRTELRADVYRFLKLCYYDWLVVKIKRLRWWSIPRLSRKIADMGESRSTILRMLLARSLRRIRTSLGILRNEPEA